MARPPLQIGTWVRISSKVVETDSNGKSVTHRSQAKRPEPLPHRTSGHG